MAQSRWKCIYLGAYAKKYVGNLKVTAGAGSSMEITTLIE